MVIVKLPAIGVYLNIGLLQSAAYTPADEDWPGVESELTIQFASIRGNGDLLLETYHGQDADALYGWLETHAEVLA